MATNNPPMLRAFGALLNFMTALHAAISKAGGEPEMIYFLQLPHAQPMLDLIAKTIVESKLWKVPKSLILEEVRRNQRDSEWVEHDLKHCWITHSPLADKLSSLNFTDNPHSYTDPKYRPFIPEELKKQDCGECGKVVTFEGRSYVVTYGETELENDRAIFLAPAEYFDLES